MNGETVWKVGDGGDVVNTDEAPQEPLMGS